MYIEIYQTVHKKEREKRKINNLAALEVENKE